MKRKDFYIGWSDKTPLQQKRALRTLLLPIGFALPVLVYFIVRFEKPFNAHQFELGKISTVQGIYTSKPKPMLILDQMFVPKGFDSSALLVGYGKFGAASTMDQIEENWGNVEGMNVTLRGTFLFGDGKIMIELTEGKASLLEIKENTPPFVDQKTERQEQRIQGEIIDPKCWFGAMKPGEGKVHKSCAIRCINGGIPPVLRVKNGNKNTYYLLLSDASENLNETVLEYVAEPIEIHGKTSVQNGWKVLETSAKNILYLNH